MRACTADMCPCEQPQGTLVCKGPKQFVRVGDRSAVLVWSGPGLNGCLERTAQQACSGSCSLWFGSIALDDKMQ